MALCNFRRGAAIFKRVKAAHSATCSGTGLGEKPSPRRIVLQVKHFGGTKPRNCDDGDETSIAEVGSHKVMQSPKDSRLGIHLLLGGGTSSGRLCELAFQARKSEIDHRKSMRISKSMISFNSLLTFEAITPLIYCIIYSLGSNVFVERMMCRKP